MSAYACLKGTSEAIYTCVYIQTYPITFLMITQVQRKHVHWFISRHPTHKTKYCPECWQAHPYSTPCPFTLESRARM